MARPLMQEPPGFLLPHLLLAVWGTSLASSDRQVSLISVSLGGIVTVGVVLVAGLVNVWRRWQVRVPRPLRRAVGRDSALDESVGQA
jgi:hypothetical protein